MSKTDKALQKLVDAFMAMERGIPYLYPHDEAIVLRAWADALMAIETVEELRNDYRQLYATYKKRPKNLEEHMIRARCIFIELYTQRLQWG